MATILQVCSGFLPRRDATNGGELRYWQNLASLTKLGHEVHLVAILSEESRAAGAGLSPDVAELPATFRILREPRGPTGRLWALRTLVDDEAAFRLHCPASPEVRHDVAEILRRLRPAVVWADWIGSLAVVPGGRPLIYSHTDFTHRVLAVRNATKRRVLRWQDRERLRRAARFEVALCRRPDYTVCVSASERDELTGHGVSATYIPIVGPSLPRQPAAPADDVRVYLFGNGHNTALRSSIAHLREALWPHVAHVPVSWHQVGEPDPHNSDNWQWVTRRFCGHGYVGDLGTLFRPGDASLVPYLEDTGFRTKFTTAAAFGVVSIGYRVTFRCAPEFTHGKDCLMAESPEELACLLSRFAADRALRCRLAEGARQLYESRYSFEAQIPKYRQVIDAVQGGAVA